MKGDWTPLEFLLLLLFAAGPVSAILLLLYFAGTL